MDALSKDRSRQSTQASKASPASHTLSWKEQQARHERRIERDNRFWRDVDGVIERMLAKGVANEP